MDYPKCSTNGLKMLHKSIYDSLKTDDEIKTGDKIFWVREFSDWKEMSDLIESELNKRGEKFTPVPW